MPSLNKSSYVILGLLSKHDYSGYELKRKIANFSSFYCSESNAQIYPVLKTLEAQGLLSSSLDVASGARNKRIYSITTEGKAELMKWLEKDCDAAVYREEFLVQLSLGQHLTKAQLIKKLQHYEQSTMEKLASTQVIINHIKEVHHGQPGEPYMLLTYDNIKTSLEAKLQWCRKVLKEYQGKNST